MMMLDWLGVKHLTLTDEVQITIVNHAPIMKVGKIIFVIYI